MKRLSLIALTLALLLTLAGCATPPPEITSPAPTTAGQPAETSASPAASTPSAKVAVPKLKGKTATGAKWRLNNAGFKVKVKWVRSSSARGRVVAQKPSGGTAKRGSTVVLSVSTGAGSSSGGGEKTASPSGSSASDAAAASAFQNHESGVSLSGKGVVAKVLSDDNDGDRHQRFILRLASGQTLLVAHNIDIAPRLSSLAAGDSVAFKGVYEWNSQGGTVHWTHHDPGGDHAAGWLKSNGVTSQ